MTPCLLVLAISGEEYSTLLNVVIGLATCLLLVIMILVVVVWVIYKMRSTARNVIKKDINPLYGIDYEEAEVGHTPSLFSILFLRILTAKLARVERRLRRTRRTLDQTAMTSNMTTWETESPAMCHFIDS